MFGLGFGEEGADFVHERPLAAEVDGALAGAVAVGEAIVGSETSSAIIAPGGHDGALAGEAFWVVLYELDGAVWGHGCWMEFLCVEPLIGADEHMNVCTGSVIQFSVRWVRSLCVPHAT